jgi:hypothetical protein
MLGWKLLCLVHNLVKVATVAKPFFIFSPIVKIERGCYPKRYLGQPPLLRSVVEK